jgi:hypothetical protein
MLGLENYLQNFLQDKKLIKKYLKQINTTILIEIIKILEEELKLRIKEFEEKKNV